MARNGLPSIQHEDFNATVYAEDAFLLYLTNFDTTASERVRRILTTSLPSCPTR